MEMMTKAVAVNEFNDEFLSAKRVGRELDGGDLLLPAPLLLLLLTNVPCCSLPAPREVKHTFTVLGWQEVTLMQIVVATGDVLRTDSKVMVKVRLSARSLSAADIFLCHLRVGFGREGTGCSRLKVVHDARLKYDSTREIRFASARWNGWFSVDGINPCKR